MRKAFPPAPSSGPRATFGEVIVPSREPGIERPRVPGEGLRLRRAPSRERSFDWIALIVGAARVLVFAGRCSSVWF